MSRPHFRPQPFHPGRPTLVEPVRIDESGLTGPTTAQARGRHWRRTSHGFYLPVWVDGDLPEQRILEAGAVLPAYGAVTGWAALRWAGATWFDGSANGNARLPVTLATSCADIRNQPGVTVSAEGLDPREIVELDGLRITTPVRSVCFEMRYARSLTAAVVALDMAAFNDLVSIDEAQAYALAHSGWTGIPQCRDAIPHADENTWSPLETSMRMVWTTIAGLGRPLCNVPIFDRAGRHVGTPDLLDPVAGVLGEYDGALHLPGARRSRDIAREAAFRHLGLECVTMMAGDLPDPGSFIRRLRQAYERAAWAPAEHRSWTTECPPWWIATATVDQRRALTRAQRARLLARRDVA